VADGAVVMALEQLLASIELEARAEIEAELASGRNAGSRIAAAAAEEVARVRRRALATEQTRLREDLDSELALARLRAREAVLHARRRFIDRVLRALEGKMSSAVSDDKYLGALSTHYEKCRDYVGDAPVVVRAATALVPRLRELASGQKSVSVQADPSMGTGFQMATSDGVFVIDATLEQALDRWKREIEIEILRHVESET